MPFYTFYDFIFVFLYYYVYYPGFTDFICHYPFDLLFFCVLTIVFELLKGVSYEKITNHSL